MSSQILEALHYKGVDEVADLLQEEASADHILNEIDSGKIMIDFMYKLEEIVLKLN